MNEKEKIANYSYKYNGDWDAIAKAIANDEEVCSFQIKEKYITILDDEYPDSLKALRFPPWIIFYRGDISLLKKDSISIVGSRKVNTYGAKITKDIAKECAKKYALVSGLAKGVDALVHQIGIEYGQTIGVIGSGLGKIYPYENKDLYNKMYEKHLIISEYPYYTGIAKHHFPWRNRIIAALSNKLIVTQARLRSGTMLTVNEAINLSKEVYCVPYHLDEVEGEGCNLLISQGAQIINNADVIRDF